MHLVVKEKYKITTLLFNSLTPEKFEWNFGHVIFKRILVIDGWGISCEIALIWMPLDFTDDKSTLVQVMAWCHQATSYYLSLYWPRSLSPSGTTRPLWVNSLSEPCFSIWTNICSKHICPSQKSASNIQCSHAWESRMWQGIYKTLHQNQPNQYVGQIYSR